MNEKLPYLCGNELQHKDPCSINSISNKDIRTLFLISTFFKVL